MTRKEALTDLLAKVEAGEADPGPRYGWWGDYFGWQHWGWIGCVMETGSLDAAKALHESMLPFGHDTFETFSLSGEVVLRRGRPVDRFYGYADGDPARAWLIAIIKALIAMEDT